MYSPRQRTPGHWRNRGYPGRSPSGGLAAGRTFWCDCKINKTAMEHRKGNIHCSSANALCPTQAIQWDKCNLTRISTNFRFEDFSWMLPWANENGVTGHTRPEGLYVGPHWSKQNWFCAYCRIHRVFTAVLVKSMIVWWNS